MDLIKEIKEVNRDRIKEYIRSRPKAKYSDDRNEIWNLRADIALPCATQNELNIEAAQALTKNKIQLIAEGANMPTTLEATKYFIENKVGFIPGKAANAGGVAVSGLEMTQNAMKLMWTPKEVDDRLQQIMNDIYHSCKKNGKQSNGYIDFVKGANVAGFIKVANAMLDQGIV